MLTIGLALFSAIFISSGINHLRYVDNMTGYAQYKKVPFPKASVILSGVILLVAPAMVILGIAPELALLSLALFLVATNTFLHRYWEEEDPQTKQNEQISFFKNISLAGAAIAIITLL
jgi:putative oxidoreductase